MYQESAGRANSRSGIGTCTALKSCPPLLSGASLKGGPRAASEIRDETARRMDGLRGAEAERASAPRPLKFLKKRVQVFPQPVVCECQRQFYLHPQSALRPVVRGDAASMKSDCSLGDRQAQSDSTRVASASLVEAVKRLEKFFHTTP